MRVMTPLSSASASGIWSASATRAPISGNVEPLAGPGEPHVGKAALFSQLVVVHKRAIMREGAIFKAGDKYDRELQALGGVDCHEGDDALIFSVRVGDLVGICNQGHAFEEVP